MFKSLEEGSDQITWLLGGKKRPIGTQMGRTSVPTL